MKIVPFYKKSHAINLLNRALSVGFRAILIELPVESEWDWAVEFGPR